MSKVIRFVQPGQPRHRQRPDHARTRPGEHRAHRVPLRRLERDDPAVALRDVRRHRDAERGQLRAQVGEIARHHRPEVGVDHRRAQPLVLAELRQDLVRDAGVGLRELLRAGCARRSARAAGRGSCRGSRPRPRARPARAAARTAARTSASSSGLLDRAVVQDALAPPPGAGRAAPAAPACRPANRRDRGGAGGRSRGCRGTRRS